MSRMSWIRNLPKTREFFTKELGGIELEGHNILGDGTVMVRYGSSFTFRDFFWEYLRHLVGFFKSRGTGCKGKLLHELKRCTERLTKILLLTITVLREQYKAAAISQARLFGFLTSS